MPANLSKETSPVNYNDNPSARTHPTARAARLSESAPQRDPYYSRAFSPNRSTSGNRRNNADFVTILQRGVAVLQKADVLFVHVHVHETSDLTGVVDQTFLDAWKARLQLTDGGLDGSRRHLDEFLFLGQFAKRSRNADVDWHRIDIVESESGKSIGGREAPGKR